MQANSKFKKREQLNSIICEHLAIEYLIRHLSLIDVLDVESFSSEELGVAQKVKEIVLKNFRNPPTIKQLTYLCATNEFKLKSYYKKFIKQQFTPIFKNFDLKRRIFF